MFVSHISIWAPGLCAGWGSLHTWDWGNAAGGSSSRLGLQVHRMALTPSPPYWLWLQVLGWQTGSCSGGQDRLQCRTGPALKPSQVPLPRRAGAFPPWALHLGVSMSPSICQYQQPAWNSFDTPRAGLAAQMLCDSPAFIFVHDTTQLLSDQFRPW